MPTTPASLVSNIQAIYTPLLSGLSFDLAVPLELAALTLITPAPVITATPIPNFTVPTLADLTVGDGTLTGTGAFDVLMKAVNKHLEEQYKKQRLSSAEWGKVYIQGIELALTQGANFVIAANTAAWAGENSKRQAQMLEIQKALLLQDHSTKVLETITAKMGLTKMQIDAYVSQGGLVSMKAKIGEIYHDILAKEAQQMLLTEQVDSARAQTKNTLLSGNAVAGSIALDNELKGHEKLLKIIEQTLRNKQVILTDEQIDAARAQTKGTITGGVTAVSGILGSQKALYDQQRSSYVHDSMNKAARLLSDAWTTQKTVDDAWVPPNVFLNTKIDPSIQTYLTTVGM